MDKNKLRELAGIVTESFSRGAYAVIAVDPTTGNFYREDNFQWDGEDIFILAQKLNFSGSQEAMDWFQSNIQQTSDGYSLNLSQRDEGERLIYIVFKV